jgi:hypothetical protein
MTTTITNRTKSTINPVSVVAGEAMGLLLLLTYPTSGQIVAGSATTISQRTKNTATINQRTKSSTISIGNRAKN